MLKFIALLSALMVCSCGDGVASGGNLLSGSAYQFTAHYVYPRETEEEAVKVDVDGMAFMSIDFDRGMDSDDVSINKMLHEEDGEAFLIGDSRGDRGIGMILMDDTGNHKAGKVGRSADGLYHYAYWCPSYVGYQPSEKDDTGAYIITENQIRGDYLMLSEQGGYFYSNMDGWAIRNGVPYFSLSTDGLPEGAKDWCGDVIHIYADPPEEDSDPWDD